MIRLGTALKAKVPPFHRCLVLSDPEANGGKVVLVRITTDDGTWPDRDCLLNPSDWIELQHASTVAFSTCKWGAALVALEGAIKKGMFEIISSPPEATLRKIIQAGRVARGMPPAAKALLAEF